jgi:diguanylate cyclase (GGDEF)-like protein
LLNWLRPLWSPPPQGQPAWRVRQVALTNRIALFAIGTTLPYQAYYLVSAPRYYALVLATNTVFIAANLLGLWINARGRANLALDTVVGSTYLQLFAVTALIGTGAGVHLLYFALGASLGMLFVRGREPVAFGLMTLATVLYLVCHYAFPAGSTPLSVPEIATRVMYVANVAGTIFLAGWFSFLFRVDIDRAERDLRRSNEQLERLSGLDPLTGLANRRTLDAHLTRRWGELSRGQDSIAILLCDVDCFKEYNDHYGHQAGDGCLQHVARTLAGSVSRAHDLVARFGGEEFVLVLQPTSPGHAAHLAEQIRGAVVALGLPHERSPVAPVVTVSVGVVVLTHGDPGEPHDLIARADRALYAAKRNGRNRVEMFSVAGGRALSSSAP